MQLKHSFILLDEPFNVTQYSIGQWYYFDSLIIYSLRNVSLRLYNNVYESRRNKEKINCLAEKEDYSIS